MFAYTIQPVVSCKLGFMMHVDCFRILDKTRTQKIYAWDTYLYRPWSCPTVNKRYKKCNFITSKSLLSLL